MTVLGFDFGLKRIGVAIGNRVTGVVTPLTTLTNVNLQIDWNQITQLIEEWRPEKLVVGIPYLLDGTSSEMTTRAERFCRQLEGRYGLQIDAVNEQLSSAEAEQRLKQTRQMGRKKKISKGEIDQLAAVIILESWLLQHEH